MTSPHPDERLRELARLIDAPPFLIPWLDRFYEPADVELVLEAAAGTLPGTRNPRELERAVRRAILERDGDRLKPADIHARYELWALFEGWYDVPPEVRRLLNDWELDDYLAVIGDGVTAVLAGEQSDQSDYSFVLLEEAEQLISEAPAVYLWPCNCRAMMGRCEKSQSVCLRFANNLDLGWELSKDRAIEVLRQSDREGLMHTAYLSSVPGNHGICNCCSDCCYPILAGEKLRAAEVWPVRRHQALADSETCTLCAKCVRRCPFGAITFDRRREPALLVDLAACRGCGLCATGCAEGAMAMMPREAAPSA